MQSSPVHGVYFHVLSLLLCMDYRSTWAILPHSLQVIADWFSMDIGWFQYFLFRIPNLYDNTHNKDCISRIFIFLAVFSSVQNPYAWRHCYTIFLHAVWTEEHLRWHQINNTPRLDLHPKYWPEAVKDLCFSRSELQNKKSHRSYLV